MFSDNLSANTPSKAPGPKNEIALMFTTGGPVVYSYSHKSSVSHLLSESEDFTSLTNRGDA